jgi:hypothetical protein
MTVSYCCSFLILYTLEEKHEANGKVVYKSRKMLHKVLEAVCTYAHAYCTCFVVCFSSHIFRNENIFMFFMVMFVVVDLTLLLMMVGNNTVDICTKGS